MNTLLINYANGTSVIGKYNRESFDEKEIITIINTSKNVTLQEDDFMMVSMVGTFSGNYEKNDYKMTDGTYIFYRKDKKYIFKGSTNKMALNTGVLVDEKGTINIWYKDTNIEKLELKNGYQITVKCETKDLDCFMYYNLFEKNFSQVKDFEVLMHGKLIAKRTAGRYELVTLGKGCTYYGAWTFNSDKKVVIDGKCSIYMHNDGSSINAIIRNDEERTEFIEKYGLPEIVV